MFDRDELEISQVIEIGLDAVLSGEATLEQVLAEHPGQAAIIRPELEAAMWLVSEQAQVGPRPGFVSASRKRVVDRIKAESASQATKHSLFGFIWPKRLAYRLLVAVVIMAMLVSGTGGLVSAAQRSLPGDNLYTMKRFSEQVALSITINTTRRVKLSAELAGERLHEVAALISNGQYARVMPAIEEFQHQVNQTVALLHKATGGQPQSVAQLQEQQVMATALMEDLTQNAELLQAMQYGSLPEQVMDGLKEAHELALSGAAYADTVATTIATQIVTLAVTSGETLTNTITESQTPSVGSTSYPQVASTATPADDGNDKPQKPSPRPEKTRTVVHKDTQTATAVPLSTDTVVPSLEPSQVVPSETPGATKTAKPTNEPKPTKTDVPTDQPQPTKTVKPTDEPKPTSTPKPTKEPKPTTPPKPTDPPVPTEPSVPTPPNLPKPTKTDKPK